MNGSRLIHQVLTWSILSFLFAPILVIVPISLNDTAFLELPTHGLSLRNYRNLVNDPVWLWSALRSVMVAAASAVLSMLVGGLSAFGCWLTRSKGLSVVRALIMLPMLVPAVVCGLAFRRALVWTGLFDSFSGLILIYVVMSLPYVFISTSASLALFDRRLLLAARGLGADMRQTIRMVLLPSIWPGLVSGGLFAFVLAWDDIVILLFATSRRVILLPRILFEGLQEVISPSIAAVASILIVLTACGVLVSTMANRHRGT